MAKARKDNKGRALRKGETQRSCDGKYVYTYKDAEGSRKSIYSKDLMELRRREEQIIKDQLDGLDAYAAGTATVNYVFDRYMSTKSELRKNTRANYNYMYNHFIREKFGKKKISSIKYSDVLQFYKLLLDEKKVQINTLETIHTLLHPTFKLAVRDDIIRTNPSDGVMAELKKQPGKNHGVRHALTIEQQMAFMSYIESDVKYIRWSPLFNFLLGTGCRIGEAIGIRWKDIDFEKRTIDINHSLVYYSREYKEHRMCSFGVSLPKTDAGIRIIPMIDSVYNALQQELEWQEAYGFNETEIDGMKGFVFMNRFGNVQNPQSVNRAIKRIYEAYNATEVVKAKKERRDPLLIPHFSCHHLRHTFCARLCEIDTNLKVIQGIMGHANIETTMDIYAEVTEKKKKQSMDNLAHTIDVLLGKSLENLVSTTNCMLYDKSTTNCA